MSRKIFLDLGCHEGQSTRWFINNHPDPYGFEIFQFGDDNLAWIYDGYLRLYTGETEGSSIFSGKITDGVSPDIFKTRPCVDFGSFLMRNFTKDDYIICKMNIEGAEYGIIPHLKSMGLLDWVDRWFIQWHYHKVGIDKSVHDQVSTLVKWNPWRINKPGFRKQFISHLS